MILILFIRETRKHLGLVPSCWERAYTHVWRLSACCVSASPYSVQREESSSCLVQSVSSAIKHYIKPHPENGNARISVISGTRSRQQKAPPPAPEITFPTLSSSSALFLPTPFPCSFFNPIHPHPQCSFVVDLSFYFPVQSLFFSDTELCPVLQQFKQFYAPLTLLWSGGPIRWRHRISDDSACSFVQSISGVNGYYVKLSQVIGPVRWCHQKLFGFLFCTIH